MLSMPKNTRAGSPAKASARRVEPGALDQVEKLGREVYGDGFEKFLETPRRSLAGETPAALIARGDLEPVIEVLTKAALGDFV